MMKEEEKFEYVNTLEWPSPTIAWLNSKERYGMANISIKGQLNNQRIVLGTNAAGAETNFVYKTQLEIAPEGLSHKLLVEKKLIHDGPVLTAKPLWNSGTSKTIEEIVATCLNSGEINLFNFSNLKSQKKLASKPNLRLIGHSGEVTGLDSNTFIEGAIVTGGTDGKIFLWDVNKKTTGKDRLNFLSSHSAGDSKISDVSWNKKESDTFAASGGKSIKFFDKRQVEPTKILNLKNEVKRVDHNHFNKNLFISGDSGGTLWDLRNTAAKLHVFNHDWGQVNRLKWNYCKETFFYSVSDKGSISVWDITKVEEPLSIVEREEGPPELMVKSKLRKFFKAYKDGNILDADWSRAEDTCFTLAVVTSDNKIRIMKTYNNF